MCNRPPGLSFYTKDLLHGLSGSISGRLSVKLAALTGVFRLTVLSVMIELHILMMKGPNTETHQRKNQLWELDGRRCSAQTILTVSQTHRNNPE